MTSDDARNRRVTWFVFTLMLWRSAGRRHREAVTRVQ